MIFSSVWGNMLFGFHSKLNNRNAKKLIKTLECFSTCLGLVHFHLKSAESSTQSIGIKLSPSERQKKNSEKSTLPHVDMTFRSKDTVLSVWIVRQLFSSLGENCHCTGLFLKFWRKIRRISWYEFEVKLSTYAESLSFTLCMPRDSTLSTAEKLVI